MKAKIRQGKRRVKVSMSIKEAKVIAEFLGNTKLEDTARIIDSYGLDLNIHETDGVLDGLYHAVHRIINEEEE